MYLTCKQHFSFPEDKEEIFKDWVIKKMAISFQTFKKNLNKDYIKKGRVPDFEKHFMKQHPFTTTEYIIANAPSPPVCFEPAVIVYHRRFL